MLRVAHDERGSRTRTHDELVSDDAWRDRNERERAVRIMAGSDLALPLAEIEDKWPHRYDGQ